MKHSTDTMKQRKNLFDSKDHTTIFGSLSSLTDSDAELEFLQQANQASQATPMSRKKLLTQTY